MRPKELLITPVLNGFVVRVGCQQVVFKDAAELGANITKYYTNPRDTEHSFLKNKVNDTMEVVAPDYPPAGIERRPQVAEDCARQANPTPQCEALAGVASPQPVLRR